MKTRLIASCISVFGLAAVLLAPTPAAAAPDLTGLTISVDWSYPDAATIFSHDDVVVGAGVEIACPDDPDGSFALCTDLFDPGLSPAVVDISSNAIHFSNPLGVSYSDATFNGPRFSGLAAGGPWAAFSLDTSFAGLDASRVTFDGDALAVNLGGIDFAGGEGGQFFEITLLPERVAPEPAMLLLLGLGLSFLAFRVRAGRRNN